MSRAKKVTALLTALALLIAGLLIYRRREIPMKDALPDVQWTEARLLQGDADSPERERERTIPTKAVLSVIASAKVTRGGERPNLGDKYFQIYLCQEDGPPTVLYVNIRGQVAVTADMNLDHYRYFKGGEELYEALSALCADKTVYSALIGSI